MEDRIDYRIDRSNKVMNDNRSTVIETCIIRNQILIMEALKELIHEKNSHGEQQA